MDINQLLELTLQNNASDLHLIAGVPPMIRIAGELHPISGVDVLTGEITQSLIDSILNDAQKKKLSEEKELDMSFSTKKGARFRANLYFTQKNAAAALRAIPPNIPSLDELNLPKILRQFMNNKQGFVLVTGPTGQGKSTTVASMLQEINQTQKYHIISIEDPIEYILKPERSIISQREIGSDTLSWNNALRSILREDPDVVFVGEMRDLETISLALTIAETGHLVFSTLHTNSAAETIDRIIDVFPEGSKHQIRLQLANALGAVISQRLIPTTETSMIPATEILISNHAVKTVIREGKTHMIDNIINTSLEVGMVSLERSLAEWVRKGKITIEIAQKFALKQDELNRQLKR